MTHALLFGGLRQGEHRVAHVEDQGGNRRDFLYVATGTAGAIAAGAVAAQKRLKLLV